MTLDFVEQAVAATCLDPRVVMEVILWLLIRLAIAAEVEPDQIKHF